MTGIGDEDDEDWAAGRRRREFIRTHHPDRGGDTESFIAGLRGFDEMRAPTGAGPLPRVVVIPHRAWPTRLVTAAVQRLRHGKPPARVR